MSDFQFGLKAILPSTKGIKGHYHIPDETKRIFVSIETTKTGKSKGKFRLTDGAMKLLGIQGGEKILPASNEAFKDGFLLALIDEKGARNVNATGTFFDLKWVEALQKTEILPAEMTQEVIFDVALVNDNPKVIYCTMADDQTQPDPVEEEETDDIPYIEEDQEEEEVDFPDETYEEEIPAFDSEDTMEGQPLI